MDTDKIVQAIKENDLTLHSLSVKSGVGYSTLHDIVNGKAINPRIDTVIKIATSLNIPINELVKKVGENEKGNFENKEKEKRV